VADESLVPQGQPYGERKATVESMRQAGMPLGAAEPGRASAPVPAGPGGVSASAAPPAGTDFLMARQPSYAPDWQPADPNADLRNLAVTSPNSFLRALLGRMLAP